MHLSIEIIWVGGGARELWDKEAHDVPAEDHEHEPDCLDDMLEGTGESTPEWGVGESQPDWDVYEPEPCDSSAL